jgi:hypothetical protein
MGTTYSTDWSKMNLCKVFVGKPERKKPLGRPWNRWEYNIKIDLRVIG